MLPRRPRFAPIATSGTASAICAEELRGAAHLLGATLVVGNQPAAIATELGDELGASR